MFLSARSYNYQLTVVNHSAQPLTITYKLKEGRQFQDLYVMSVEDRRSHKKMKEPQNQLAADASTTDVVHRVRTITLPSNRVVLLEEGDYWREREGGMMDTIELKLSGASGGITYAGDKFYENIPQESSAENDFSIIYG